MNQIIAQNNSFAVTNKPTMSAFNTKMLEGIGGESYLKSLSIKAKAFRVKDGEVETVIGNTIRVIVVDGRSQTSKRCFEQAMYDSAKENPIICSSDDGIKPNMPNPICSTCSACAYNAFQSDPVRGKGKRCKDFRRLVVYPLVQGLSEPLVLDLPPTSFKNSNKDGYLMLREAVLTAANRGVDFSDIVWELGFTPSEGVQVCFTEMGVIDANQKAFIDGLRSNDDVQNALAIKEVRVTQTPVAQVVPQAPVAQVVTQTPVAPVVPQAPVAQVVPQAPVAQAVPQAPVAQVVPQAPVAQVIPQVPVAQVVPQAPVAQAVPQAPVAQVVPQAPVASANSEEELLAEINAALGM